MFKVFLSHCSEQIFITISCTACGYTELYKAETSSGLNILDFFMN
ncbi:zinc ribbon domain-containing protein [Paenibacillus sp. URB8-2]|nr:zinc ribbon domain-containing protein [Paenibacillus sp. URB8-2]